MLQIYNAAAYLSTGVLTYAEHPSGRLLMEKDRIIFDSSVIVSALEPTDVNYVVCRALIDKLINGHYQIRIPMHGIFEIACTFTRLRTIDKKTIPDTLALEWQKIPVETIPIDDDFVKEYLDQDLPYLRAGDYIYLAMSKKMGLPLITNDKELYLKSRLCGISVFTPEEFLSYHH
jgi:predicted nucleic acid-binding protein